MKKGKWHFEADVSYEGKNSQSGMRFFKRRWMRIPLLVKNEGGAKEQAKILIGKILESKKTGDWSFLSSHCLGIENAKKVTFKRVKLAYEEGLSVRAVRSANND